MDATFRSVLLLTLVVVIGVALLLGGVIIGRSGWGMPGYGPGMMGNPGNTPHNPGMMNMMGGSMADMMRMHGNEMQPCQDANPCP